MNKLRLNFIVVILFSALAGYTCILLTTLNMNTFAGTSGSGYTLGIALVPLSILLVAIQLIASATLAYFIVPLTVNAIKYQGNPLYQSLKSMFICWSLPYIILSLLDILIAGTYGNSPVTLLALAIAPALIGGPLVGRMFRKKVNQLNQ
jgi:hypothetical protein